jgi:hypothetical protein
VVVKANAADATDPHLALACLNRKVGGSTRTPTALLLVLQY